MSERSVEMRLPVARMIIVKSCIFIVSFQLDRILISCNPAFLSYWQVLRIATMKGID